jgi:FkbH-like protein
MYEPEVNGTTEPIETLPPDVRERFAEFREKITARTAMPWGEHCTECVWPVCYTTCELYSPRIDGACRQFVDGMVRIDNEAGLSPYLLKLRFKQWAKLWAAGTLNLETPAEVAKKERLSIAIGSLARNAPLYTPLKSKILTRINVARRKAAEAAPPSAERPDCFLLECFNPNANTISLTLTVRSMGSGSISRFQKMLRLAPGYTRTTVAVDEIFSSLDPTQAFEIELVPNECNDTVLYFGLMDFVKQRAVSEQELSAEKPVKPFKCIVWDLDNTVWDGILVEDGPHNLRVRERVLDIIRKTDERGILHSVASKNNREDAIQVLEAFGISDYILYPQISWEPKSQSIAKIAQLLNIGQDSIAFVDDQAFEREEVRTALPQVRVIDAADCFDLPERAECQVPVTAESRNRRTMYRQEEQRQTEFESYSGDYLGFLRSCGMRIALNHLDAGNLKRVFELAQRTNQMNFSGSRYKEDELARIMSSDHLETFVVDCADRFGNYGIVGFAVVDKREPRLLDLMFSCRVQGKRVEHAVLSFIVERFSGGKERDFHANYRKTPKNAPSGKVFEELGFESDREENGVSSLVFRRGRELADDKILTVTMVGAE